MGFNRECLVDRRSPRVKLNTSSAVRTYKDYPRQKLTGKMGAPGMDGYGRTRAGAAAPEQGRHQAARALHAADKPQVGHTHSAGTIAPWAHLAMVWCSLFEERGPWGGGPSQIKTFSNT